MRKENEGDNRLPLNEGGRQDKKANQQIITDIQQQQKAETAEREAWLKQQRGTK